MSEIWKELFKKSILPLAAISFLYFMATLVFKDTNSPILYTLLFMGFPFGVRQMFIWIIPGNHHSAGTAAAIFAMSFVISAFIGIFVMAYYFCIAIFVFFKSLFSIINIILIKKSFNNN